MDKDQKKVVVDDGTKQISSDLFLQRTQLAALFTLGGQLSFCPKTTRKMLNVLNGECLWGN